MTSPQKIGILALQGGYDAHRLILEEIGATPLLVRSPEDLAGLDGIIVPGGESTVMSRLCERYGLMIPLKERIEAGMPALGTCAGLIFLAKSIEGGSTNFTQTTLGVLDVSVERNAYGAQLDSFETDIEMPSSHQQIHAVFIRAPRISRLGENVEVLASHGGAAVLVRQGQIVAAAFHPELAGETGVHSLWLENIAKEKESAKAKP